MMLMLITWGLSFLVFRTQMTNLLFVFQGTEGLSKIKVYVDEGAATVEVIPSHLAFHKLNWIILLQIYSFF